MKYDSVIIIFLRDLSRKAHDFSRGMRANIKRIITMVIISIL